MSHEVLIRVIVVATLIADVAILRIGRQKIGLRSRLVEWTAIASLVSMMLAIGIGIFVLASEWHPFGGLTPLGRVLDPVVIQLGVLGIAISVVAIAMLLVRLAKMKT